MSFIDLSHTKNQSFTFCLFLMAGIRREKKWKREVEETERYSKVQPFPQGCYVLHVCFRSVRSCGLQNFRYESILCSFSGDILQCSLYLQMCETLIVYGIVIYSFHKFLLSGLQRKMISFNSHCRLPVEEESRIIMVLSLQMIRLHFKEVK